MLRICALLASLVLPAAGWSFNVNDESYDTVIRLHGETTIEQLEQFRQEARQAEGRTIVSLDGPGGDAAVGMQLAKEIRSFGFDTVVEIGSFCASACTAAWFGGVNRYLSRFSPLQVHTVYLKRGHLTQRDKPGNDELEAVLRALDVPRDIVYFMVTAAPDRVLQLDPRAARSMGLDFREF